MNRTAFPSPSLRPRHPWAIAAAVLVAVLAVASAAAAQSPPAPRPEGSEAPRARGDAAGSQLFHVTLVAASRENGAAGQDDLPRGVAKALDDIKDFLPYRGFRVVDSSLVRASHEFRTRLGGPDGSLYEAQAIFTGSGGTEPAAYLVEHFELRRLPRVEDMTRELDRAREGRAVAPLPPATNLTASFRIARGETVVVGSSRLDGGEEALIVLLTAVP